MCVPVGIGKSWGDAYLVTGSSNHAIDNNSEI